MRNWFTSRNCLALGIILCKPPEFSLPSHLVISLFLLTFYMVSENFKVIHIISS